MRFAHIPVLLKEVIKYLDPQPNQDFIDCTIGGAGHSREILKRNGPQGKLLGIELDPLTLKITKERLQKFGRRVILVQDNFANLEKIVQENNFDKIRGILLDLGLSSILLEKGGRGFSFQREEPLDMRFDPKGDLKARDIVNHYSLEDLQNILRCWGEIREARKVALAILAARKEKKIQTTKDLVAVLARVKNLPLRLAGPKVYARVFQALRIAVNEELKILEKTLPQALKILEKGGRLVVISFHSLEDRVVKKFFQKEASDCLCPPYLPVCICQHKAQLKILTGKPLKPKEEEVNKNPRARSALLRVAQKI